MNRRRLRRTKQDRLAESERSSAIDRSDRGANSAEHIRLDELIAAESKLWSTRCSAAI